MTIEFWPIEQKLRIARTCGTKIFSENLCNSWRKILFAAGGSARLNLKVQVIEVRKEMLNGYSIYNAKSKSAVPQKLRVLENGVSFKVAALAPVKEKIICDICVNSWQK
ncbi:MAG: hypothetical protein HC875_21445 [Anaerolineales bacterium]|nr:hypothetical protein [Anaerolineales bacterium]